MAILQADGSPFAAPTVYSARSFVPPPNNYVVADMLNCGDISLFVAKPKVGKTTAMESLCDSVLRGKPWMGRETKTVPTYFLALESSMTVIHQMAERYEIKKKDPFHYESRDSPILLGNNEELTGYLIDRIKQLGIQLCIIDMLACIYECQDWSNYSLAKPLAMQAASIARQTGAHVLVTHHAVKGDRTGAEAAIGSQALSGTVDAILHMDKNVSGTRHMMTECRNGAGIELPKTSLRFDREQGAYDLGEPASLHEAIVQRNVKLKEAIRSLLKNEPRSVNFIHDHLSMSLSNVRKFLKELILENRLVCVQEGLKNTPGLYQAI